MVVFSLWIVFFIGRSYAFNELYCKIDFNKFTTAKYGNCIGNISKTGRADWNNSKCSEQYTKTMGKSLEDFRNDLIVGPTLLVLKEDRNEFEAEIQIALFEGVSDSRHPGPGAREGGSERENRRPVLRSQLSTALSDRFARNGGHGSIEESEIFNIG